MSDDKTKKDDKIVDDTKVVKKQLSKEEKAKIKFQKIEAKRAKKEKRTEVYKKLNEGYKEFSSQDAIKKRIKDSKVQKVKDKIDFKLAAREFPVKVIKEIQKVRWPSGDVLVSKLIWVLAFIFLLALVFYGVDTAFQHLFTLAKIL